MSAFVTAVDGLRGPLEFALRQSGNVDRVDDLGATLSRALRQLGELWIPVDAKRRCEQALRQIEARGTDRATLEAIAKYLEPLLQEDYPRRVLTASPERVPGVGPKIVTSLTRKEINSVEDLLFFLPRAYEDRRELLSVDDLQVGHSVCFEATVTRAAVVPMRNGRRFFQAVVGDGTGAVHLKWFRGLAHFKDRIKPGQRLLVAGDVRRYRYAKELHHPEVEFLRNETDAESLPRIVPVYSVIEGIPPRTLRRLVEAAVHHAADLVEAYLPPKRAKELELAELGEALRQVHLPTPDLDPVLLRQRRTPYHLRLAAEELFLLQMGLESKRSRMARRRSFAIDVDHPAVGDALRALPFELTNDQKTAWGEIAGDLSTPHPMNRLLGGDVGTGKTVVAWLGAVATHASGGLTALLAPTEILAEQHYKTFYKLAKKRGIRVALLTGSTPAAERKSLQRLLQLREIHLVIGTHALLTDSVRMPGLRFVVIDEQHRFGVEQRQALSDKGENPHVLVMTATPIPRTLALTVFGDLDHSVLRERPPGRAPITTTVVPSGSGRQVLDEVKRTLERGEQIYVVYPLVEESEKQDLQDATRGFERLQKALPNCAIALVHGRMDGKERVRVMGEFAAGRVQLLVSTTVIEVGVDVHNATLLVVQHAERFGLSQLHQLRGRVGRGNRPGQAILIGDPKTEGASKRLAVLEATDSGFDVAEEDLKIRGAGEWLGTRQAGHLPELRIADLIRHAELLPPIREAAALQSGQDPELNQQPRLKAAIERRWGRRLGFSVVA